MHTSRQERTAERLHLNVLQVYLCIQEAVVACGKGNFPESYRLIEQAQAIANQENMVMEMHMCNLEYGGIKIKEGKPREVSRLARKSVLVLRIRGTQSTKREGSACT